MLRILLTSYSRAKFNLFCGSLNFPNKVLPTNVSTVAIKEHELAPMPAHGPMFASKNNVTVIRSNLMISLERTNHG